jgi:serine/threonine protein kinase
MSSLLSIHSTITSKDTSFQQIFKEELCPISKDNPSDATISLNSLARVAWPPSIKPSIPAWKQTWLVKVIRTEKFTPEALGRTLKRFEGEAQEMARLTHPNLVPVIDYSEYEGAPYLVMPYLGQIGTSGWR